MTKIHSTEQLVLAAEKVFLEKGYDAARVEDIGAELGVLQGSLYYHIGSKAGLLRMVLRHRFADMLQRIEDIASSDAPVRTKLRDAIVAQLGYHDQHLPDLPQWFRAPGKSKEKASEVEADRQMVTQFREAWQRIIKQGITQGEIKPNVDPEAASLAILGMCNYVARWHHNTDLTHESIADDQLELIWSGMHAN